MKLALISMALLVSVPAIAAEPNRLSVDPSHDGWRVSLDDYPQTEKGKKGRLLPTGAVIPFDQIPSEQSTDVSEYVQEEQVFFLLVGTVLGCAICACVAWVWLFLTKS